MLALSANRTVSSEELIDGLWAERPPPSAAKNVQLYVSRLRKAFGSDDCGASIVTHGRGYELRVSEDAVDAVRFEQLIERARRDADQALANGAAKEALELWHGAPLADVAAEPFALAEIRRLDELHTRATELAIDAELAAGRHGEVIGGLETLRAEHPLNERFLAQQMLALYRAGRQSEALEAYRRARRTLGEEVGLEPTPELRHLHDQVLAQDPALDLPPPTVEIPRQLEGGSPLLAGRERELRWLRERWKEARPGRSRVALVGGPVRDRQDPACGRARGRGTPQRGHRSVRRGVRRDCAAVRGAGESERPTLLVLDDAEDAPPSVLEAAALARAGNRAGSPCSSSSSTGASGARRRWRTSSGRQGRSACPWIACGSTQPPRSPRSTRPPTASRCRSRTLMAESDGVRFACTGWRAPGPRRWRPSGWTRRSPAATGERELGATRDGAGWRRRRPPGRPRAHTLVPGLRTDRSVCARGLSVPRSRAVRCGARRVFLRPRAAGRRAGRAPGRLHPAGGLRAIRKRQVLRRSRRTSARAGRRGAARLGALAADADATWGAPARGTGSRPREPRSPEADGDDPRRPRRSPRSHPTSAWSSPSINSRSCSPPVATRASGPPLPRRSSPRPPTPTSARSSCSRSGPTSTGAAPTTGRWPHRSAPTSCWSGR